MTVYENFELAPILWYKIGGRARYLLECHSTQDILEALDFIEKKNISRVFILGIGSNLVFTDDFFDGAVLHIDIPDSPSFEVHDDIVTSYAGEILGNLILFAFDHRLNGLEWAGGLPGTVGAGVRGNVGAFGGEIKDVVESVDVAVIENGRVETKTLSNSELEFAYRSSVIKTSKNMVVLWATFRLVSATDEQLVEARATHDKNMAYRQDRHPLELPNCGSVFKNISKSDEVEKVLSVWPDISDKVTVDWHGKVSMGYINHKLGFSGYRVGNAQVSEKHNNFIVNLGNAKATDVKKIIADIQSKVTDTFGFTPEVEVEIVE